jgi:hypothetical protein
LEFLRVVKKEVVVGREEGVEESDLALDAG